jgi:proline dehydrogenase
MLRHLFLFLSEQSGMRRWMENSSVSKRFTRRFIAGETLDLAIRVCAGLEGQGILSTLDHLGEKVTTIEEAARSRDACLEAIGMIIARRLPATISLKLTQLGLDLSEEACLDNVRQLAVRARAATQTGACTSAIEIDMESSSYTDRTLRVTSLAANEFGCVRAVIQAYLFRSAQDIDALNRQAIPVRLVKGAYEEPASVAFAKKRDVDRNYVVLMKTLLEHGVCPAIATHDEKIIDETLRYARSLSLGPERLEFQMLYGIRRDLQRRIVDLGYRLRLYVPYGTEWYPYFMRRLAERPANVLFVIRNLLRA